MKPDSGEIDEGKNYTGYREALDIIASCIHTSGDEEIPLNLCSGRVASSDVSAVITHPSDDISLKDGYAVRSDDVIQAGKDSPVPLDVTGSAFAGVEHAGFLNPGSAVKICSGAKIPAGADAVVSSEFCGEVQPDKVMIMADAGPGRNIQHAGVEITAGSAVITKGERILPGKMGLAAAAGVSSVRVYRRPHIAVISIGDEVVLPGNTLGAGQLYASNMITMEGWLALYGIPCITAVVKDSETEIAGEVRRHLAAADIILTSGGAWSSERDLAVSAMDKLGWNRKFHYLRMGPGKGTAFGMLGNIPVFCLPGGPASNRMAFLQLALPAIIRMSGEALHPLHTIYAKLTEDVKGRHIAWTEFKDAVVTPDENGRYAVSIYRSKSRLQGISGSNALVCIPEGTDSLHAGDIVHVQLLTPRIDILQFTSHYVQHK